MKINSIKGTKGEKDRIFRITTEQDNEWFSIYKLSVLANQLAINEWNINGDKIKATGNFFFRQAVEEAMSMAELGIDWSEEKNLDKVKLWCERYALKFEVIEPELRKIIQTKIEDFKNENI